MYWLLDPVEFEKVRKTIIQIQTSISLENDRSQSDQIFPFNGRKDRAISRDIIEILTSKGEEITDPFGGSGIFAFAAMDIGRTPHYNEWEPYAFRMVSSLFRKVPSSNEFLEALDSFKSSVESEMFELYKTKCPKCGHELMFQGLFYDRDPLEYFHPTRHDRMGPNGENVVFRRQYGCPCGCKEKKYDDFDESVREHLNMMSAPFPNPKLIENSRINFTAPFFTQYSNLFSKRQQLALYTLKKNIDNLGDNVRYFFEDCFISMVHLGKYVDYRCKSQDNHCPSKKLRENNLYFEFLEKIEKRWEYVNSHHFDASKIKITCLDFRDFLKQLPEKSQSLILTDPPYGDNSQYFEHAQRVHPWINYSLVDDKERLNKEVVISDAPSRINKHSKDQFMGDIEKLFALSYNVLAEHRYLALYFRPEQKDWISDLNRLKDMGRRHGFEPLVLISVNIKDPSMRALQSAAWTFKNDVCFIFLRLNDNERRWYEGTTDIDELIYLAAKSASKGRDEPFILDTFFEELLKQLRANGLVRLSKQSYQSKFIQYLARYADKDGAHYRLKEWNPYIIMNSEMNAESRLREFIPEVVGELTEAGNGFTFEEFIIHLSSYMENGSKKIIDDLKNANKLIPGLLDQYAYEDEERKLFFQKNYQPSSSPTGRTSLLNLTPKEFEILIGDYFKKRGYTKVKVIGNACDRGVDVTGVNPQGEVELIQCKRYRQGNNVGSTAVQRIDSQARSRKASKGWVITTSDFTVEGLDEARILGVLVMNGTELIRSLELYFPGKYSL